MMATADDLLECLQTNFRAQDRVRFWHEGGAYMNCERVSKSTLGNMMW